MLPALTVVKLFPVIADPASDSDAPRLVTRNPPIHPARRGPRGAARGVAPQPVDPCRHARHVEWSRTDGRALIQQALAREYPRSLHDLLSLVGEVLDPGLGDEPEPAHERIGHRHRNGKKGDLRRPPTSDSRVGTLEPGQ